LDEIVELLESKLAGIDNEALANEDIGSCYYNLGLAYYSKTNYQAAKKYYLSALKHLPNDQDTILELIKIFLNTSEIKSAANYIKNLESKDIKNLLEMGLDLSTISTTKFNSVKNKPVPKAFSSLISNLEYIAKFNEGKFSSNNDKINAFKSLCKKCNDNHVLLSTAIYTKQDDFIREIVKKSLRKNYFKINICGNLKLYLD
jgi:tetratricopeptide (TPR) repeat protein